MAMRDRYDRRARALVEFLLLGLVEVRRDGRSVPIGAGKQRALLAFLLLNANEPVSRERLIDELWGAHPPATVSTALRVRIAELRRLLEPDRPSGTASDVIVSTDGRLVMNVAAEALDVLRFEALVEEAEAASAAGDHEPAAELLRDALALWRGPALEDFTYEPFAQPAIARLEELRATALERRIDADLALGRHERLAPELRS